MKSYNNIILCTIALFAGSSLYQFTNAQEAPGSDNIYLMENGTSSFPELIFAEIPGAPKLGQPQLVMGETKPVMGEGMGWASPAFYDVDGDGKKDLLIGEFGSRMEDNGIPVGNFVRVYTNIGTETAPKFNDFYSYIRPVAVLSAGTPISIYTWCCLGFTPRLIDMDKDGYADLLTGQYEHGFITWFRGSKEGFLPGVRIPQFGDYMVGRRRYNHQVPWSDPESWFYWNYSAAAFGDIDNDGLYDMVTGGETLRFSKNIGTVSEPGFGRRVMLLDTAGNALKTPPANGEVVGYAEKPRNGYQMVPYLTDWDNDGVLDLLVTDMHAHAGSYSVSFFRGVGADTAMRFEPGIPLFTNKGGGKAFPGAYLHVCVADWNNDGVKDLLIGTNVPVRQGKLDDDLAWSWEHETKSLKVSPAYYSEEIKQKIETSLAKAKNMEDGQKYYEQEIAHNYGKLEYKDLAHQGYVYVMLGRKVYDDATN